MFGLEEVAARWAAEEVDELHEASLGEEIVELRLGIDRLEAQVARRVAVFKRRKGHLADGSVSIVAWLRHNCRLTFSSASERAALAELVDATPATAEAFAGGEIGYDNARVIARTVVKVGAEAYQPGEAAMLDAARRLDPERLAVALRLACDSALTRIAADDSGEPLDAGRTVRTVPPAIRRALVVRDRGCASRAAIGLPTGPTASTCGLGLRAARQSSATWSSSAAATIAASMRAAGGSPGANGASWSPAHARAARSVSR